jgi:Na+:H+ antiporter, NhaA family
VLKSGLGSLPAGVTLRHLVVLGAVAGVGFTMALFIADLAFVDAELLTGAKLGVLAASLGAGVLALVLGRVLLTSSSTVAAALTADEAESSTEL